MPLPLDLSEIEALISDLTRDAETATAAGRHADAARLYRRALVLSTMLDELRRLSKDESSASLQPVTGAQLQRRGRAIARAKAAQHKDPLWTAITESKWGSQERYARERLGVSPGSLSAYRSGNTPCPRSVAAKVLKDFGIGDEYWSTIVD